MPGIVEEIKANPVPAVIIGGGAVALVFGLMHRQPASTPTDFVNIPAASGSESSGGLETVLPPSPLPHPAPGPCGDRVCAPGSICIGGQCVSTGVPMPHFCLPGRHWDDATQACVLDAGEGDPSYHRPPGVCGDHICADGYVCILGQCVPAPPLPGGEGDPGGGHPGPLRTPTHVEQLAVGGPGFGPFGRIRRFWYSQSRGRWFFRHRPAPPPLPRPVPDPPPVPPRPDPVPFPPKPYPHPGPLPRPRPPGSDNAVDIVREMMISA